MSVIELRFLENKDKEVFFKAFNEKWESNFDFVHYWESLAKEDFERYVQISPEFSRGKYIPVEHVPCSLLFAFNKHGEIVGRTSIRHEMTEHLLKVGGHIGYGVCPSHRRNGYATEILKESIKYIKSNFPAIGKVLVTCDEGNIGSQKTIEKNDGILEDIIDIGDTTRKMRFWINL